MFPFSNVNKGDTIIIYGAGNLCKEYLPQITSTGYCKCIAIVDKNSENLSSVLGIPVVEPEHIKHLNYDKIVIASKKHSNHIYSSLLEMGVDSKVIVRNEHAYKHQLGDKFVFINDYSYTPKHRDTLQTSKIGSILNEWYCENKNDVYSLFNKFFSYKHNYEKIPFEPESEDIPNWNNGYVHPLDAISVYGFLAEKNPRYYVEVGSGNTTLFAAQSIRDNNLRTKIISIDPFPRASINKLCHELYRIPFEDMDLSFFNDLTSEDILLIDNSHRAFPNSDVTVFFTEVLPSLASGLLYTMHDIFLPFDYSEVWSSTQKRWYNEQYMLCAYLLGGGGGDKIVLPAKYLGHQNDFTDFCKPLRGKGQLFHKKTFSGGFFWMEKA